MIITHLKQAWQLLRQNKLFSTIYIVGTALAIASTTIFAIIYYARLASVYPEYQKDRILTLSTICYDSPRGDYQQFAPGVSNKAMTECFYHLKNAEAVSGYREQSSLSPVFAPGRKSSFDIVMRLADPAYFNIINYEFLSGAPFSQEEFDAGSQKAVISDRVANKLGLTPEQALGQSVNIGFVDYEICGVFREGRAINNLSYVQAVAPYTSNPNSLFSYPGCDVAGILSVLILSNDEVAVRDEINEYFRKYASAEMEGRKINTFNQPRTALKSALSINPEFEVDLTQIFRQNFLILLTLLIVPALNLSGMIASRMDSRMGELGIRKSFGASRGTLLSQVLWENLWLTIIGGLLGLALTWIILSTNMASSFVAILPMANLLNDPSITVRFTADMLFAPAIFGFTFLFCVLLNILSALIPAYGALRRPIVTSLK
ncbi:MAG: ABC transporter permease [Muribaculaceae bacterium]|nr:ABC transporter permease [Muribaculaceae bacterium]